MSELLEKMRIAILDGEEDEAVELAEKALDYKMDLKVVMSEGFLKGINEAGQLYSDGKYFLPDLVCAADAMKAALAILAEELKKPSSGFTTRGKFLIVTVEGDVHDIGKTIVGAMMTAVG
ncbi:MAG: mttC6, partial [bacterium]